MVASSAEPCARVDQELVRQFLDGDERSFDTLYRRHAQPIAAIVFRLTGEGDDLEDIVQETFADAARTLGSLKDHSRLRSWLITIAARKVRKLISKRQRSALAQRIRDLPRAARPSPERDHQVREEFFSLPAKLRMPWVLHVLEKETIADTAKCCGVSMATAKRRIQKAQARLERRLQP